MATTGKLFLNPIALNEMLNGDHGLVAHDIIRRAERVKDEAIRIAPVGKPDPLGRARKNPPGNLRDHITKRVTREGGKLKVLVGIWGVPYAYGVHEGNPAHVIEPRTSNVLVFMGKDGIVFTRRVNHPGNAPNRFLMRALSAAK